MKKRAEKRPQGGESAWLAAKAEMARRNDAARARGSERHAAYEASRSAYRRAGEREEALDRPEQPHP